MVQTLLLDNRTLSLVEEYSPEEETLNALKNLFSVFADGTRIRIITALCLSEMCVTDISRSLKINQTTASHQLKILRDCKIISARRQGKIIFYSANVEFVDKIMLPALNFIKESKLF